MDILVRVPHPTQERAQRTHRVHGPLGPGPYLQAHYVVHEHPNDDGEKQHNDVRQCVRQNPANVHRSLKTKTEDGVGEQTAPPSLQQPVLFPTPRGHLTIPVLGVHLPPKDRLPRVHGAQKTVPLKDPLQV